MEVQVILPNSDAQETLNQLQEQHQQASDKAKSIYTEYHQKFSLQYNTELQEARDVLQKLTQTVQDYQTLDLSSLDVAQHFKQKSQVM